MTQEHPAGFGWLAFNFVESCAYVPPWGIRAPVLRCLYFAGTSPRGGPHPYCSAGLCRARRRSLGRRPRRSPSSATSAVAALSLYVPSFQ